MKEVFKKFDRGFSMLTVIFVILATAIAGTAVISLVSTSSQMLVDERYAQMAFDVAQAGISYEAQGLAGDNDWSDNTGDTINFGEGVFTTTYIEHTLSTATVRSVGDVAGTTRTVEQDFNRGSSASFDSAIYTEDDFEATGGSSLEVEGTVTTGGIVDVSGNTSVDMPGPIDDSHADADMPDVDWSYWKGQADQTILGNYVFSDGTHTGIYYVSGKVEIKNVSNFVLNGTIIARDDVQISDSINVTISAEGRNPAIVAEGRILMNDTTSVTIEGWLFSLMRVGVQSLTNFIVTGGIAAVEEVRLTGNSAVDINFAADRSPDIGFVGGEPSSGMESTSIVYGDWYEEL